ncbi:MAG: restriction endonuclease subunit S [Chlorobium sp.]|nr:MAG: restriction endonuclease subunit S [Chlorobium sp.]
MRAGWEVKRLGDVCEIVNGGTPKTGVPEYWDGKHLWITPAEMGKRQSPFVDDTERKITDLGLRNSSASMLPAYSVILSSRAPIGHLVINTDPMATNQGCKGLIPTSNLNFKFLYYYCVSIVDLLNSLGAGATFKELSGSKLKEVVIPLPSFPEQQRIVAILDEAFEGIATAKANAEKNLKNARALFDSHLNSVFSQRGEGWEEKSIEQICSKITDGEHIRPKMVVRGVPFLSAKNVLDDNVFFTDSLFVSEVDAAKFRKRCNPEQGDILIVSRGATVGRTCVVNTRKIFCLLGSVILLKVGANYSSHFVAYALKSPAIRNQLMTVSEAAAQPAIYLRDIKPLWIGCPSLTEQKKIVEQLDFLRAETQPLESIYQKKITALDVLKKSILHKAFSGEL